MAICILVLQAEENAYGFWEKLKSTTTPIKQFQIIEPSQTTKVLRKESQGASQVGLPETVKIKDVKIFNPKLERKERQRRMSLWLMPFGFLPA